MAPWAFSNKPKKLEKPRYSIKIPGFYGTGIHNGFGFIGSYTRILRQLCLRKLPPFFVVLSEAYGCISSRKRFYRNQPHFQHIEQRFYGYSPVYLWDMTFDTAVTMVHGVNERIHKDSVRLGTDVLSRAAVYAVKEEIKND